MCMSTASVMFQPLRCARRRRISRRVGRSGESIREHHAGDKAAGELLA